MEEKINLLDLTSLSFDYKMSKKYVKYLSNNTIEQYRHEEIRQIKSLIELLSLDRQYFEGFYYSYLIKRLNKEFDLIKVSNSSVINIELKSKNVGKDRILKQLIQNRYYLKLINKNIYNFTYINKTNTIYYLSSDKLVEVSLDFLKKIIKENKEVKNVDLGIIYSLENISASPLYTPLRFLKGEYVLTEAQENAKLELINNFSKNKYIGLTGQTGTGKTLLIYDIAKKYINNGVLIIDTEPLIKSQDYLINNLGLNIIYQNNIDNNLLDKYNYIFIDEAHKLNSYALDLIINSKAKILFSFDKNQIFTYENNDLEIISKIEDCCNDYIINLSYKKRLEDGISSFIDKLFNLNKDRNINFSKIHIKYFNSYEEAKDYAYELKNVCYFDYDQNYFYNKINIKNISHSNVYGKEYQNIAVIMDDRFYYFNNRLYSISDTKFNYKKLLFYYLTRSRNEIYLLVVGKKLMKQIEKML